METNRWYGEEAFNKVDRGGFKNPTDFPTPFVLCNLKNLDKGFLGDVSEPHLVSVCEDWDDNSKEDFMPSGETETPDGITYDLEGAYGTPSARCHGFDVRRPVQGRGIPITLSDRSD